MEATGHNTPLSQHECHQLIRVSTLGRVAWTVDGAVQVLPVSYATVGEKIVFRTARGSLLSQLVQPQQVGFEVEDLDPETQTGWSVLVHGLSRAGTLVDGTLTRPWAPGRKSVVIEITPSAYTGRAISAS